MVHAHRPPRVKRSSMRSSPVHSDSHTGNGEVMMRISPVHSDSHSAHVFAGLSGVTGTQYGAVTGARTPRIRWNEDVHALAIKLLLADEASMKQLPELLHALCSGASAGRARAHDGAFGSRGCWCLCWCWCCQVCLHAPHGHSSLHTWCAFTPHGHSSR